MIEVNGVSTLENVVDMRVSELSIVSFPCYEQTDIQVAQRALVAFQVTELGQRIDWLRRWAALVG